MFCVDRFNVFVITEKQTPPSAAFCSNVNYMADSAKSVFGCKSLEKLFLNLFSVIHSPLLDLFLSCELKNVFQDLFCVCVFASVHVQVKVNNEVATGTGPNKKVAKRNAAEAMLLQLGYKASTVPQNTTEVGTYTKI